jgi:hypothetical protein
MIPGLRIRARPCLHVVDTFPVLPDSSPNPRPSMIIPGHWVTKKTKGFNRTSHIDSFERVYSARGKTLIYFIVDFVCVHATNRWKSGILLWG